MAGFGWLVQGSRKIPRTISGVSAALNQEHGANEVVVPSYANHALLTQRSLAVKFFVRACNLVLRWSVWVRFTPPG
jgi:hypothetical protein